MRRIRKLEIIDSNYISVEDSKLNKFILSIGNSTSRQYITLRKDEVDDLIRLLFDCITENQPQKFCGLTEHLRLFNRWLERNQGLYLLLNVMFASIVLTTIILSILRDAGIIQIIGK